MSDYKHSSGKLVLIPSPDNDEDEECEGTYMWAGEDLYKVEDLVEEDINYEQCDLNINEDGSISFNIKYDADGDTCLEQILEKALLKLTNN